MNSDSKISFEDYLKNSSDIPEDTYNLPDKVFSDDKRSFDFSLLIIVIITLAVSVFSFIYLSQSQKPADLSGVFDGQTAAQYISSQTKDGKVNINTADIDMLCTLDGIGETRAFNIISYRLANGDFKKTDDIMKVKNIGPQAFKKIKDKICV